MINSNYSITQLFLTHDIEINVDNQIFKIHLPSLRELYTNKS